ncbi:MAG: aldehyde dehydrogenase family protein [Actinobacteria bacterium]|jgi:acyl-CoA reductase-like NAD-dependent aldehyde dehydrogenase|nr:aldehyde dehydrogenase family protein [Actinomycetota bacterium]NCU89297.1 aldehyde dehydrogenase family protein [Actinomycetota bacterium]NDE53371.1 aldehyde dehydrogenase family protein [Actinomycetota bacterium]
MRIDVKKTYKLFIGGQFPRSESGRSYELFDSKGNFLANPALASRKDLRDAVVAARNISDKWSSATAFNRSQILYRVAEVMEGRKDQFIAEIIAQEGVTKAQALKQVNEAIDLWVWYAGWCDKIASVYGGTNPVSGSFYNFTTPENLGVVASFISDQSSLTSIVHAVAPILAGGNTLVAVAHEDYPLSAITLSEVIATSDVPGGVVNILTGKAKEIAPWVGSHMDIDGVDGSGLDSTTYDALRKDGADNLKRINRFDEVKSPQRILAYMEHKTVWHPIGI